jgi:hypothetical protein
MGCCTKQDLLENGRDVISHNSDRKRTYIAAILRFAVEGMGDVGAGRFLMSRKGDKLLYDDIAMLVCT